MLLLHCTCFHWVMSRFIRSKSFKWDFKKKKNQVMYSCHFSNASSLFLQNFAFSVLLFTRPVSMAVNYSFSCQLPPRPSKHQGHGKSESLKKNTCILFTIPTCVRKRKNIFRVEYCHCISRAQTSSRENREVSIMKCNLKAEFQRAA